jgi:hypothetical protein
VVTLLVVIVANIDDTESEANCWRRINEKTVTDYIIYLSSFVLPNFLALVVVLVFLLVSVRIKVKMATSLCLFFPLSAVPFMVYDMVVKFMTFFREWQFDNYFEIPLVLRPFCHGVIFALVLRNLSKGKRPTSSDLTIAEETSFSESMIPPEDPLVVPIVHSEP